jgi:hypothetical protein
MIGSCHYLEAATTQLQLKESHRKSIRALRLEVESVLAPSKNGLSLDFCSNQPQSSTPQQFQTQ